jgi:cell division protein FtsZ
MARERNILTIGVVTKPFGFEGKKRMRLAEEGIAELQAFVDTLIVIPNQNLFKVANERTGWKEAFEMADNVLYMGVRGVTDLMVLPGLINLDYADIRSVMREMGKAMNITGGSDITLFEMDQAANRIREEVDEDANIMVGMALDESLNGRIRISVVATGIDSAAPNVSQQPKLQVVGGGHAENVPFPPHAQPASVAPAQGQLSPQGLPNTAPQGFAPPPASSPAAAPAPGATVSHGAGYIPQPPAKPLVSAAYMNHAASEFDLSEPEEKPARQAAIQRQEPAEAPKRASLFSRVFGGAPASPAPAQPSPRAAMHREPVLNTPQRAEPEYRAPEPVREATREPVREPARAAVRPAQIDEIGLEIPAFLRRSNS